MMIKTLPSFRILLISGAIAGLFSQSALADPREDRRNPTWKSYQSENAPENRGRQRQGASDNSPNRQQNSQEEQQYDNHQYKGSKRQSGESGKYAPNRERKKQQRSYIKDDRAVRQREQREEKYRRDTRHKSKHLPDSDVPRQSRQNGNQQKYRQPKWEKYDDAYNRGKNYRGKSQEHRPDYTRHPPREIHRAPVKRHRLQSNHTRYQRQRHAWYNTRFLAPIRLHRHRIEHRVRVLPRTHFRLSVGGLVFFYDTGVFYRPYLGGYIVVRAPLGALVYSLPPDYVAFTIGLSTFYYANDTYYRWSNPDDAYVVVDKPAGAEEAIESQSADRLFVYPNLGQDEEQQAKDRYECHQWAVSETDFDPTLDETDPGSTEEDDYKRAISACLEARGYTVK